MIRSFSHSIAIAIPPQAALPLFTPKGEEDWVPGWAPEYLHPSTGETVPEMLFRTGDGEETTLWTCLAYDVAAGHARYLRITPASRVAYVDVRCVSLPPGSRVDVRYDYVPLNEAGQRFVSNLTEEEFRSGIEDWVRLISQHMANAVGEA